MMKRTMQQLVGTDVPSFMRRTIHLGKVKIVKNDWLQGLLARKWTIILVIMAFLLGRATILDQLTPFSIAYFAVIFFLRKDLIRWVTGALLLGSLFSTVNYSGHLIAEMIVFTLLIFGLQRFERAHLSSIPGMVGMSTFLVQLFSTLVTSGLSWYSLMLTTANALLALVLTMIFIQAIPVITLKRKALQLKNEQIICLIILLASVMTGTVGWTFSDISVEHILSRYLILLFAFAGGAPLGASVGVVTGLILSLADVNAIYQISLLAFGGMLAGMLREGKKIAVSFGMLLGTTILSIYVGSSQIVLISMWESLVAIGLFFLTSKSVTTRIAEFIPSTQEHVKSQQDYAKRVRDLTASRVEQFSEIFKKLASSFSFIPADETKQVGTNEEVAYFMNRVCERTCSGCRKQRQCWGEDFYKTYKTMDEMIRSIECDPMKTYTRIPSAWKKSCIKPEEVLMLLKQEYEQYHNDREWKKQLLDSRMLVSDQLVGVSEVMKDLAKEIKREGQEMYVQEEQIRKTLEELGLFIQSIDIISLEEGNVEIEVMHQYTGGFDECRKIIAPLLSDILGENIAVKHERPGIGRGQYSTVIFGSAKEYEIETGIASVAKGGDFLSGDSFSMMELGNGKFAVAISDGMGNGERAQLESSTALTILHQLLQSGMDERLAIKSVNSVLLLRSADEIYATVDVAIIDQYNAQTTFVKIGSTPSFIKRGSRVIQVSANNLPVGIVQEIDVDLVRLQLKPDDLLIMMTDGIYDAPGHAINKELWLKRLIQEMETDEPQEIADLLLEKVIREQSGQIADDMTVVVAKVAKHKPEWATFRWHSMKHIERPKTVS